MAETPDLPPPPTLDTRSPYPDLGTTITLGSDDEGEEPIRCRLQHCYGAARLYQAVDDDGQVGVVALQPDGSWWIVRDFEDDSWRGPA